jgi:signal transduction histidine kinase
MAGVTVLGVRPAALLGAVTAVLGVLAAAESIARADDRPPSTTVAVLTAVAVVAPLALTRFWPVAAVLLSTVACLFGLLTSNPVTAAGVGALAAMFAAVGRNRPLRTVVALPMPFVIFAALPWSANGPGGRPLGLALVGVTVAASAGGAAVRMREERRRRRATEQSTAASLLRYAARDERARIARELHDVVAHHITMIALQADAARLATPGLPPDGARRLTAIGDTARTALTEMRRLLGVLREDVDAEPVARQPQPGLRQLYTLVDEVRDTGTGGVRLIVSGPVEPLDHGIELTAYRIVQEALTNARRHAPGAAIDVELQYGLDELRVRVYDNGPGPSRADGTSGHGLAGMRERAGMVGGQVTAGPGPGAGFLVDARLPTKGTA